MTMQCTAAKLYRLGEACMSVALATQMKGYTCYTRPASLWSMPVPLLCLLLANVAVGKHAYAANASRLENLRSLHLGKVDNIHRWLYYPACYRTQDFCTIKC